MLNGKLDKNVPIPLYFQLKKLIIEEIKKGCYQEDSLIPTEKEFMEKYEISRTTVRQAMTELVQEGWIYRVKSKGTFVTYPKINHNFIQTLESFNEQMERAGTIPKTEVIALKKVKASEFVADGLGINEGDFVVFLYRKRFANEEAIVLQKAYLRYDTCAFILDKNFEKESLYKSLAATNQTLITHVKRIVEVDEATEEDSKYLGIDLGKPIQAFTTTGFNVFGEVVEFSLARYRGDRSRFEVSATI
ncbi:MAG: GntR family transcriptional regulator [Muribaculaceae bacterium]